MCSTTAHPSTDPPRLSDSALLTIEAQQQADETVRRVASGELDAEGLALALGNAYGLGLQALARALTKAVRGHS